VTSESGCVAHNGTGWGGILRPLALGIGGQVAGKGQLAKSG